MWESGLEKGGLLNLHTRETFKLRARDEKELVGEKMGGSEKKKQQMSLSKGRKEHGVL